MTMYEFVRLQRKIKNKNECDKEKVEVSQQKMPQEHTDEVND